MDPRDGPIAAFAYDLRQLRRRAGEPSYRQMTRVALFAPSVLSSAARGQRLPTLQVTLAFVEACGGDRTEWEARWRALAGDMAAAPAPPGPPPGHRGREAVDPAVGPAEPPMHAHRLGMDPAGRTGPPHHLGVDPTGRTGPPRPAQLPPAPTVLVGRRAELAQAQQMLTGSAAAPLLIGGGIGVGKTALALRLATELAADLPDGQLYADLGGSKPEPAEPGAVLAGFLRALGVVEPPPDDIAQRVALYRSLLAERRALVLLDDVADEAQIRPLLPHSGTSVVLLTSRARLLGLDSVRRLRLEPFDRAESLALLAALCGAQRVAADPRAAGQVVERCSGLPLALSIAGRRLAARPGWPMSHLADRLADRGRLLDRLRVGDLSVRERLESAYRRLSPAARRALAYLGSRGGTTVTSAHLGSVGGEHADDVEEALVESGLLQPAPIVGAYRMPPLVQLFAAEHGSGSHRQRRPVTGSTDGQSRLIVR